MIRRLALFAYLVALATWGIMSYASFGQYILEGSMFARLFEGRPYVSDFVNVYNAGLLSRRAMSEHINIYDPAVQDESVRKLIAPVVPEAPFNLQYPPYFFALMLPLSFFSLTGAWLVWNGVFLTGLVTTLRALVIRLQGRMEQAFCYVMVFASYPTWVTVELGQTSLPEFLFVIGFFHTLRKKQFFFCGLIMAFITIKLQYTPFFGIIGLMVGGLPFLGGLFAALSGLCLLSWMILGGQNLLNYPLALLHGETSKSVSGVSAMEMQNLRGNLALLMHADNTLVHLTALVVMSIAVVLLAVLWRRYALDAANQTDSRFELLASCSVLIALTTSLHTHSQDYIMAALPCIWLWQSQKTDRTDDWIRKLIAMFPIYSWMYLFLKFIVPLIMIQPLFAWAVVMCVLTLPKVLQRKEPLPDSAFTDSAST